MKKKILIVAAIAVVVAVAYLLLGGAEKVTIIHEEVNDYMILGVDYEGRYRSKELRTIYEEVKNKLDSGIVEGVMVIVNYNMDKDSLENGFIHQFLGIQLTNNVAHETPNGYSVKEIKSKLAIKVQIGAHNLVMPNPNEIVEQIEEYALTNNLTTVKFTIEKYISDRELVVEVPIID